MAAYDLPVAIPGVSAIVRGRRMRNRQHVNPLGLGFETFKGQVPALVPGRPVEVEIGCADAQFLFERAAALPDRTYVGVEIRENLVDAVNEKAAAIGAPVLGVFCNANMHLTKLFPKGSVARVFVNFPDPWFKKRHHKRRMVDETLAGGIAEILAPGGDLWFQSDVWDISLDAIELFERRENDFENVAGPWRFFRDDNPYGARSWREANAEATGLDIWRLRYRRR